MDLDDVRSILRNCGVDIWTLINTAIDVTVNDYREELRIRRDGIVERLYAPPPPPPPPTSLPPPATRHQVEEYEPQMPVTQHQHEEYEPQMKVNVISNRANNNKVKKKESSSQGSPSTPQSFHNNNEEDEEGAEEQEEEEEEEEEEDEGRIYGRRRRSSVEDEKIKILDIKEQLEDPHQSEENLVHLLQELADMDITFKALKETDIGRHVNLLRKHPSEDVCRVVKQIVRKWKYLVDAWVKGGSSGQAHADGDSPQRPPRNIQNGHHQVPDFGYSPSPNTHNGSSGSDKNNSEPEPKQKVIARREPQTRPSQSPQLSSSAMLPNRLKEQKNAAIDADRLASARKRLHDNYQEAQNAKKQRTIQVMDLHDIPKPKNSFFSKNKGGSHQKHW